MCVHVHVRLSVHAYINVHILLSVRMYVNVHVYVSVRMCMYVHRKEPIGVRFLICVRECRCSGTLTPVVGGCM